MKKSNQSHSLSAGEHFAAVNDIIIHYHVAGSGPVLLLPSPGWGPSVDYIRPLPIFEQYFTTIYFDARHSGKSTGPEDPSQYALDNFVADIEALRIYLGESKIFIAGHSGAGHQVLEYGIRFNNHLAGIISIDAIATTDALRSEELMKRVFNKKSEPYYLVNPSCFEKAAEVLMSMGSNQTPRTLREMIEIIGCFYFHKPELARAAFSNLDLNEKVYEYTKSIGFQGKNLLPELASITVPTLVITGDDDFICDPVSQAARIHQQITSSKLAILENCGHFPWIEQPEVFSSQCELWFNELGLTKTRERQINYAEE